MAEIRFVMDGKGVVVLNDKKLSNLNLKKSLESFFSLNMKADGFHAVDPTGLWATTPAQTLLNLVAKIEAKGDEIAAIVWVDGEYSVNGPRETIVTLAQAAATLRIVKPARRQGAGRPAKTAPNPDELDGLLWGDEVAEDD